MRLLTMLILLAAGAGAGCASIPGEAVELSKLTGEMAQSAKLSHVRLANQYFDFRRKQIEQFAFGEYKRAFLRNVRALLKENDPNFTELTFDQYDSAMERIRKKVEEWVDEVESYRGDVLQALEEHYPVMLASNEELTSLVRSAANLSETRASLLQRWGPQVGISGQKIEELERKLARTSEKVSTIMSTALAELED